VAYKLLFLCTGNYYRSRYAEILFNSLAADLGLNWKATSRGLATEIGHDNIGPMNAEAMQRLINRGIQTDEYGRFPIQLQDHELAQADLIIAMDAVEHRPYLEERFPDWPDRVDYWHIRDLGYTPAEAALAGIEKEVSHLIERLSNNRLDQQQFSV